MFERAKELIFEAFRNDEVDMLFSGKGKYSEVSKELTGYIPENKRFHALPVYDPVDTESILAFTHELLSEYEDNGFPTELAQSIYEDDHYLRKTDFSRKIQHNVAVQFVRNINKLLDSSDETDVYYGIKSRIMDDVDLAFDYVWDGGVIKSKVSLQLTKNLEKFINSHIMEGKDEPLGLYDYFVKIDKNRMGHFNLLQRYRSAFIRAFYSNEMDKLYLCDDKYVRDGNGYLDLAEDNKLSMTPREENYHIDFPSLHTEIKELVKECPEYFTELPKKLAETLDKLLENGKNAVINYPVKEYYTIPYAKILFDEMSKPYRDKPDVFNLAYQYLSPETIERASMLEGRYTEEVQTEIDKKKKEEAESKERFESFLNNKEEEYRRNNPDDAISSEELRAKITEEAVNEALKSKTKAQEENHTEDKDTR